MNSLLAAAGATVAALLESTVVPYVAVGAAHPHLVLVLGVVWTVAAGVESGLVWAFVGGVALDTFAQRPLGSSALGLLVSLGGAATGVRLLARFRPLSPLLLVFAFSLVNSLLFLVVLGALRAPIREPDPLGTLMPGVLYDTALAALIGPIVILLWDRHTTKGVSAR
jgi:rod shape-determining protein MreD